VNELDRLLVEQACHRVVVDYARWLDAGDGARFRALFTSDAVWDMAGHLRLEGGDAITERLVKERAERSIHVVSNVAIDVVSADEATGFARFVNYRGAAGGRPVPRYVGRYVDRFTRTADGWRIAHRRVEIDFADQ
jgi:ketosteroid isomerase-like protein